MSYISEEEQSAFIDKMLAPAIAHLEDHPEIVAVKIAAEQIQAYPGWDQTTAYIQSTMPRAVERAKEAGLYAFSGLLEIDGVPVLTSALSRVEKLNPDQWIEVFRWRSTPRIEPAARTGKNQ